MKLSTLALLLLSLVIGGACSKSPAQTTNINSGENPQPQIRADFSIEGKLLFVKDGLIYVLSGGTARKLTSAGTAYENPAGSPDGRRIAAVAAGQNHSDLVVLSLEGKLERQLTKNLSTSSVQSSAWARRPAWSPDGARLAYVTDRGTPRLGLWIMDVANANTTPRRANYQPLGDGDIDSPSWSKDGKKLAFTAFWEEAAQLYVLDTSTGVTKRIMEHKEGVYDAAWSPDGSKIAYVKRVDGKHDIWTIDPDGGQDTRVTSLGAARSPAWSPDGQMVAFVANQGQSFDLYVVKVPTNPGGASGLPEAKQLTRGQNVDAAAGISWSR